MLFSTTLRMPGSGVRALAQEIAPGRRAAPSGRRYLAPMLSLAAAVVVGLLIALHGGDFIRPIDRALHASWSLVALGALLEAASLFGYIALLHRVVARAAPRLRFKESYDITLAGTAATRLLPTAGLGGAAVTIWALRARGVRARELAERLLAFFLLIYGVYMLALLASGAAVAFGLVRVSHGRALGLVGVLLAITIVSAVLSVLAAPSLSRGLLRRLGRGSGRLAGTAHRVEAELPALRGALRRAWLELRRPHPALLGAVAWWGFDIAVLAAMLHAFGVSLPFEVVVLAYFLGTLFNLLPIPGSLSGGLVGTLVALGSPAGGAVAAVLAYRAIAVWLPAFFGTVSLSRLRVSVGSRPSEEAASGADSARGGVIRTGQHKLAV